MSQEIQFNVSGSVKNPASGGGYYEQLTSNTYKINQANQAAQSGILSISTTAAAMSITVTAPCWCYMINLDSTNYFQVGYWDGAAAHPVIRVLPGDFALFRIDNSSAISIKANTATVLAQYWIWAA